MYDWPKDAENTPMMFTATTSAPAADVLCGETKPRTVATPPAHASLQAKEKSTRTAELPQVFNSQTTPTVKP